MRRLGFAAVPCQAMANLAVQIWVRTWGNLRADGMKSILFILYIGCTWILLCRGRRPRRPAMVGGLTHMRSMCVGVTETGVDHWSPAKIHKDTFSFIVLLYDQKYQKSKRGRNPSFKHLLSPRGDRCEHTSPTVRLSHSHGYRLETLKRRLGFTAVPC